MRRSHLLFAIVPMLLLAQSSGLLRNVFRHRAKKAKLQKDLQSQVKAVIVKVGENYSFEGVEKETFSGSKYYAFLGIPFAKRPVENLRFKPPQRRPRNGKSWDATYERSPCVQFYFDPKKKWKAKRLMFSNLALGNEDCLYLNVYTPRLPTYLDARLLPVMVWVHGGGFLIGGAQQSHYSPEHFINEGVLMAAINYRLGAFGFLTTGDQRAPGNNGLRDQVMALEWIRENVAYFGGNPKRVTLFGQSAGAASVSYLIQTNRAKDLFANAILQSGTSLCPWALARELCPIEKYNKLKQTSAKKVLESSMKETIQILSSRSPINGLSYGPVSEKNGTKAFFHGKSHEKLMKCDIGNRVPILVGFNAREEDALAKKLRILQKVSPFLFAIRIKIGRMVKDVVPIDMKLNSSKCGKNQVSIMIRDHYNFSDGAERRTISPNLMRFIGDNAFVRPVVEYTKLYSNCYQGTNTFAYEFAYEAHGVGHGDELPYFFAPNKNDSVYLTAKRLVRMWTNFAKTSNPTPTKDPVLQNIVWPSTSEDNDYAYLEIGKNLTIKNDPRAKDVAFWDRLYKKCGTPPFDTY